MFGIGEALNFGSGLVEDQAQIREAKAEADRIERVTAQSVEAMRLDARRRLSAMKLAVFKGGAEFSGSPASLVASNAAALEQEAFDVEIRGADAAALLRRRARLAQQMVAPKAVGSLLGGASRTASIAQASRTASIAQAGR
jgi:hypothetical protein